MIKVIFNESFISDLNRIDNTIKILGCSINSDYKTISNLNELFDINYPLNDDYQIQLPNMESIWEPDLNSLKINIDLSLNSEKYLTKNYSYIYIYYSALDGLEKIAFILGNFGTTENLNLSISNNLINIPISSVKATLLTQLNPDNKFLEGVVNLGANLFTVDTNTDKLVSKRSYFKYKNNHSCYNDTTPELPYINIDGETISTEFSYREYSEIILDASDNILSNTGGIYQLKGIIKFKEYLVRNNRIPELISEGEEDIINSPNLQLNSSDLGKLNIDFKVLSESKIEYEPNLSGDTKESEIYLSMSYIKPDKSIVELVSNSIKIYQGDSDIKWKIVSDTNYVEDGNRLYILNSTLNSTTSFRLETVLDLTLEDISITNEDEDQVNQLFKIEPEINGSVIFNITTLTENRTNDYIPSFENKPLKYTLKVDKEGQSFFEEFYVVQQSFLYSSELIICSGDGEIINEIILDKTADFKSSIIIAEEKEGDVEYLWTYQGLVNTISLNPNFGNIVDINNPEIWPTKSTTISLINVDDYANSVGESDLGLITLYKTDDITKDVTNWRVAVSLSQLNFPIKTLGDSPVLSVDQSIISISEINLYPITVTSNSTFTIELQDVLGELRFYDSANELNFVSETIKELTETIVYLECYSTTDSIGNLKISSGNESIDIPIQLQQPAAELSKIDPISDYIFLNSNQSNSISFRSNVGIITQFTGNSDIITTEVENIFQNYSYDRSYVNLQCTNTTTSQRYPTVLLGKLSLVGNSSSLISNVNNILNYDLYLKGEEPYILAPTNQIQLDSSDDSIIDVDIESNYELTDDNFNIYMPDSSKRFQAFIDKVIDQEDTYRIRIKSLQKNESSIDNYLGQITLISTIPVDKFIDGEPDQTIFNQDIINSLAGFATTTISIYQTQSESSSLSVSGDKSLVAASGESRSYNVIGTSETYSLSFIDKDYTKTNYSSFTDRIISQVESVLTEDYFPTPITDYINILKYRNTREVGFTTIISQSGEEFSIDTSLIQVGYNYGIFSGTTSTQQSIYLGNSDKNIQTISLNNDITSVNLYLGLFELKDVLDLNSGNLIHITSTDEDSSNYNISIVPPSPNNPNVFIQFPSNESGVLITRSFNASIQDLAGEIHRITINITQSPKNFNFRLKDDLPTGSIVKFHASGQCIDSGFENIGIFSEVTTNIPKENIHLRLESGNNLDYELINFSSNFSNTEEKVYRILLQTSPNYLNAVKEDVLYIEYKNNDLSNLIWSGNLKQGYLYLQIEDSTGKAYTLGTDELVTIGSRSLSDKIGNPWFTGPESDLTFNNRLLYKLNIKYVGLDSTGEILDPINVAENNLLGSSVASVWNLNGIDTNLSISDCFETFNNDLVNSQGDLYLEFSYDSKSSYYKNSVGIFSTTTLKVNYPDLNISTGSDFIFRVYLTKQIELDGILPKISPQSNLTVLDPLATRGFMEVIYDVKYSTSTEVDWITLDQETNYKNIYYSLESNKTGTEREGVIYLVADQDSSITNSFKVVQPNSGIIISETDLFDLPVDGSNKVLTVTSILPWSADSSDDWITVSKLSDTEVNISIAINETGLNRFGSIDISTEDQTVRINIEQNG